MNRYLTTEGNKVYFSYTNDNREKVYAYVLAQDIENQDKRMITLKEDMEIEYDRTINTISKVDTNDILQDIENINNNTNSIENEKSKNLKMYKRILILIIATILSFSLIPYLYISSVSTLIIPSFITNIIGCIIGVLLLSSIIYIFIYKGKIKGYKDIITNYDELNSEIVKSKEWTDKRDKYRELVKKYEKYCTANDIIKSRYYTEYSVSVTEGNLVIGYSYPEEWRKMINTSPELRFSILDNKIIEESQFAQKIPLNNIIYYKEVGDFYRETKISGGGDGGISIGGAIIGGIIAGGAGAVIGSRREIKEVKSEIVEHDTRMIELTFKDSNGEWSLTFNKDAKKVFDKLIPDKEFEIVETVRKSKLVNDLLKE